MTRADQEQVYRSYTQAQFIEIASVYDGQFEEGHPAHARADSFLWVYCAFPLSCLPDDDWKEWYANEVRLSGEDGRDPYYIQLEQWWLESPWEEPAIVVQGSDRLWYIWDGNHRVGISATHDHSNFPAFLGIRK